MYRSLLMYCVFIVLLGISYAQETIKCISISQDDVRSMFNQWKAALGIRVYNCYFLYQSFVTSHFFCPFLFSCLKRVAIPKKLSLCIGIIPIFYHQIPTKFAQMPLASLIISNKIFFRLLRLHEMKNIKNIFYL